MTPRAAAVAGLLLALALPALPAAAAPLPFGVASGDIGATTVILWAQPSRSGPIEFEVSTTADFATIVAKRRIASARAALPVHVRMVGLKPGASYFFRAVDAARNRSTGSFRTLPAACADADVAFGATGDWRGELAPYPAIRNLPAANLDFLVALGDTIYAENYSVPTEPTADSLAEYRAKHRETLTEAHGMNVWPLVRRKTPMFAVIDDHEVVNDFAGGANPTTDDRFTGNVPFINRTKRYADGLKAFNEYMPIADATWPVTAEARFSGRPRLLRSREIGRTAMFVMVDARSFRDVGLPAVQNLTDPVEVGTFLAKSFDPSRTMLGRPQVSALKRQLLAAKQKGIVWKFVFVPEPIQNLGVLAASDRFEGYAAERAEILGFIDANDIENVVFVTADMHGTLVNNLTYQVGPGQPQIPTTAWEIITGAVAFDAPFGQTVVDLAAQLGLIPAEQKAFYDSLPIAGDADAVLNDKDDFVRALVNQQVTALGYDSLGLEGSGIPATLLAGGYEAAHTYGWTAFKIDGKSRALTVTTYGIAPYTFADLQKDPDAVTALKPAIVSKFTVDVVAVAPGTCGN